MDESENNMRQVVNIPALNARMLAQESEVVNVSLISFRPEFKENKTHGLSNTVVNNLLRADQVSYKKTITKYNVKVNKNIKPTCCLM